ncbi:hypothetical protein [Streptomyces sp. NPDC093544]
MRLDVEGVSFDAGAVRLVDDIRLSVSSGTFVVPAFLLLMRRGGYAFGGH